MTLNIINSSYQFHSLASPGSIIQYHSWHCSQGKNLSLQVILAVCLKVFDVVAVLHQKLVWKALLLPLPLSLFLKFTLLSENA